MAYHYAEGRYAGCHILSIVMMNIIRPTVIMLNVIMMSAAAPVSLSRTVFLKFKKHFTAVINFQVSISKPFIIFVTYKWKFCQ
jgi:hypothetical protein